MEKETTTIKSIIFKPRELHIKMITTKSGDEVEVVNINKNVAFDPMFIEECKENGVRVIVDQEEEETEELE